MTRKYTTYLKFKGNPLLHPLYTAITKSKKNHVTVGSRIVTPSDDLVIEGYQRSANSYAVNMTRYFYPMLRLVHHTHSISTLKLAKLFDIPTIILIRHPKDAIASAAIATPNKSTQFLIENYIWFYNYVFYLHDKSQLHDFDIVINQTRQFLASVGELIHQSRLSISDTKLQDAERKSFNNLRSIAEARRGDDYYREVAYPEEQRKHMEDSIKDKLRHMERYHDALALYESLRGGADNVCQSD